MKLGSYTLIKKIAEGGVADIYLAKTKSSVGQDKYLVCKCIKKAFSKDTEFLTSILNEAQFSVRLHHPNIIDIFDLCSVDGNAFLVMEYLDANNFQHLLKKNAELWDKIPYDIAIYAIGQAALGLHAAHELTDDFGNSLQLVHRDISPENILFSSAGDIKISDFGIAKTCKMPNVTAEDVIKGKFNYMSPEQAWGDKIDKRSDIYSLAIVLYEAVLGQKFNPASSIDEAIDRSRMAFFELPRNINPDFPEDLEKILLKALNLDKKERYSSALEFKLALDECAKIHHWNAGVDEWLSYLKSHSDFPDQKLPLIHSGEIIPDASSILKPALTANIGFTIDSDATCQVSPDDLLKLLEHKEILPSSMQNAISDDGCKTEAIVQPAFFSMKPIAVPEEMKKSFSGYAKAVNQKQALKSLETGKTEAILQPSFANLDSGKTEAIPQPSFASLSSGKTEAIPQPSFADSDDDKKTESSLPPVSAIHPAAIGEASKKTEVILSTVKSGDSYSSDDSLEDIKTEASLPPVAPIEAVSPNILEMAGADSSKEKSADSPKEDASEIFAQKDGYQSDSGVVIVRKGENTGEFAVISEQKLSRKALIAAILFFIVIALVILKVYFGE